MRNIISLIFFLLISTTTFSQNCEAIKGKTSYSFWLHQPDEVSSQKQPVFIFLHGRSLCGNNLNRVKRYGLLYAMEKGQEVSGFVIAPQSQAAWNADKVIEVLDYVLAKYPQADASRVYVCGMSLGGYGTMEVAGKYPDRIAAAVAICGGGCVSEAENLSKVPIWLLHGTADRIVPVSESRKIYKAILKSNPNADVKFDTIKGGTHGSVEKLFHKSDIYNWMLSHKKGETPVEVN